MKYKILVVEDDQILRLGLKTLLEKKYEVKDVGNANEAIDLLEEHNFHLILTDLMMDGGDGYELLKYLNNNNILIDTYVISALDTEDEMIKSYNFKILDYIIKPINFVVLDMKINNYFKNKYSFVDGEEIVLNKKEYTVTIKGEKYDLTEKEYEIINLLVSFPNNVFSKYDFLNEVWYGNMKMSEKIVEVTISNLRNKLGVNKDLIKNKRGQGYYYEK